MTFIRAFYKASHKKVPRDPAYAFSPKPTAPQEKRLTAAYPYNHFTANLSALEYHDRP